MPSGVVSALKLTPDCRTVIIVAPRQGASNVTSIIPALPSAKASEGAAHCTVPWLPSDTTLAAQCHLGAQPRHIEPRHLRILRKRKAPSDRASARRCGCGAGARASTASPSRITASAACIGSASAAATGAIWATACGTTIRSATAIGAISRTGFVPKLPSMNCPAPATTTTAAPTIATRRFRTGSDLIFRGRADPLRQVETALLCQICRLSRSRRFRHFGNFGNCMTASGTDYFAQGLQFEKGEGVAQLGRGYGHAR